MRCTLALLVIGLVALVATSAHAAPIGYAVRSNGNDHLYSIDLATGAATDLGLVGFGDAEGLAFVGNQLFGIGGSEGVFWNLTTPPGSLVGNTGPRNRLDAGLDYNPTTGTLYNIQGDGGGSTLYTINVGTGAATLVGSGGAFADNIAIDAAGNAFAIDAVFSSSLYSVNLSTGALTLIGPLGIATSSQVGTSFFGNTLYALFSNGNIYTVNTATGAVTLQATTLTDFEGLAIQQLATEVPEPTSIALWSLLSVAGVAAWRRRKNAIA